MRILWDEIDDEVVAKLKQHEERTKKTLIEVFKQATDRRVTFLREKGNSAGERSWEQAVKKKFGGGKLDHTISQVLDVTARFEPPAGPTLQATPLSTVAQMDAVDFYREHLGKIAQARSVKSEEEFCREIQDRCRGENRVLVIDRYLLRIPHEVLAKKDTSYQPSKQEDSIALLIKSLMGLPETQRPKRVRIISEVACGFEYKRSIGELPSVSKNQRKVELKKRWNEHQQTCIPVIKKIWLQAHERLKQRYNFSFDLQLDDGSVIKKGRMMHDRFLCANNRWFISSAGFSLVDDVQKSGKFKIRPTIFVEVNEPDDPYGETEEITEDLYR